MSDEYADMPVSEANMKAKTAALRALELDDSLAEAHTSLAAVVVKTREWKEAEKEYKRAVALNADYPTARQWYALLLIQLGRLEEAHTQILRAQQLDPVSRVIALNVGLSLFLKGDFKAAAEQCEKIIQLDPAFSATYGLLANVYPRQGRDEQAITNYQKAVELSRRLSGPLSYLGYGYAKTGKRNEALAILHELEERYTQKKATAGGIARIHAGLGENDEAFKWLEKGFQDGSRDVTLMKLDTSYESLRGDPRFNDFLKRLGLPL